MQRLVGQKALVPTVRYSSTYRINNLAARKITSKDGTTTNLQHQRSYNTNTRSIIPIAWKMPSPSPGDIKAADEKFKYLAKTAEWKSFNATQIQMMYRMYREQLKRKMETIPIEELQAWADKYLMDGESPPKLRSPLKSLFATKQDWDKELTKIADKMLGGENEFKERMKRWEIEMFSDEKHIPIWSEQYATLHQISPEYYMKNAEFQVLMASMRALESKRDDPLFRDPYAEALVKNCGPTLSKYYDALEPFSNIHILDAAQLFTSRNALPTDVLSNYEKQFPRETDRDLARDYFAVRTKYFDNFLLERFSTPDSLYLDYHEKSFTKERQVVILGGGLDMRAFRLQFPPNTTVFEIDDEEIMEYKESMIQQNGWKPSCARRVAIATAPLSDVWEAMLLRSGFKDYIPTIWVAEGSCTYVHSQLVFRGSLLSSVGSWAAMEMMGDSSSFNSALLHHPSQIPFKTSQPKKDLSNRGFSLNGADEIGGPQANFGRLPGRTFFNKIFSHPPGYFVYGQKLPVDEASNKMKQLAAKQQIAEMQKGKVNHLTDRPEARMREEILEYDMYNLETNALTKQRAMQKSLKDIYVGTDVGKLLGSKNQPLIEKLQNEILQLEEESTERTERNANRNMKSDAEFVAERQEFLQKIYNGFRHIITETWIEFEEWRLEHKHTERLFMLKELEGMVAGKVAELFLHPDKYDEKPIEVLVREEKLKKDEEKYFKDVVFRNAWMHLSEGLTRLGVDTKENNESKAYRMLQNYMEPKEIPPPREKTKEQLKFEQLMEEDHQKQMEWQEEIVERQIMLHETLAEYAQNILDKRIQKADPRPIRKNRWIDASDRLLKEDIPLELQQKEKEVMLRLFKHGFTEEEKEIYQMRRDWKLRRQFAFQNATNSYQVSDVLNQINKEELEAKKKGKWRDDAWFLKIDQMVESWKDLGDPKAMPQVENNMALPQPYTWKRPKTRQLELIAEEERKKGQDISKYWYPKGAARGQYHMLQTDPRGLFAVPKIPVPGDLPKYMIWLYQRYRSPMPELPFRGMAKRVEMTRLLRNRASGWRKVKPRFRFERKFNRKRRTSRKLDPMTVEQKREIMVQRGDVIRAVPRSTAHKGRRVPTTHKMWGKFFSKMTWAVYDEWKQEYHAKLQEEKEFEAKKEVEGEKEGPKEGNEGKDSKKKSEH